MADVHSLGDAFFRRQLGGNTAYRPVTVQSGRFSYRIGQNLTNLKNSGGALRVQTSDRYVSSRLEDGIRLQVRTNVDSTCG